MTSRYDRSLTGLWGSIAAKLREPMDMRERASDVAYTVVAGDRVDAIANTFYGDPDLWWVVCDWNDIRFPLALEVGKVLRLPSKETLASLL